MDWLRRFMMGRHGGDALTFGILAAYFVLAFLANLFGLYWLLLLSCLLLVWALFRMLSRQHEKRARENQIFLAGLHRIQAFFRPFTDWIHGLPIRLHDAQLRRQVKQQRKEDLKTHVYLACPGCGQQLRLPRGKGKLNARCPKCGHQFQVKT